MSFIDGKNIVSWCFLQLFCSISPGWDYEGLLTQGLDFRSLGALLYLKKRLGSLCFMFTHNLVENLSTCAHHLTSCFSGLLCRLIFKDELFQKLSWAQPGSWFSTDIWKFPLCRSSTILDWLLTFTHIYQSFTPKSPIWIRINQLLAHFWAKYRWYMVIPMVIFRWIPGTRYTNS